MTSTRTKRREFLLGQDIVLGRELARGGEGTIHEIDMLAGHVAKNYVAKKYFKPSSEKTSKLKTMLVNVPQDPTYQTSGHISIAWPAALILHEQDECIGFIMPYINHKESFPLLRVYNPQDRRKIKVYNKQKGQEVLCEFTWRYLLRMAYNLAEIVKELHNKGYVVGDLNESNILVTAEALVTLVDCDSMQVPRLRQATNDPTYFRCPVGKPEYTPPELQGQDFSLVDRTPDHDNFCLAVLIFLMLMEGRHPFAGAWQGDGPPPTLAQNIQAHNFPYVGSSRLKPPKNGLPFKTLPPDVQTLMRRCFAPPSNRSPSRSLIPWPAQWNLSFILQPSSEQRPTAQEWAQALEKAEGQLIRCQLYALHFYSRHLKKQCPWCIRMERGIPDPFPSAGAPLLIQKKTPVQAKSPRQDPPPLPAQKPSPAPKRSSIPVSRQVELAGFALLTFALYIAEFIIVYLMRSYIPFLLQGGPIVVLITLFIFLFTPIAMFIWFIRS
jgi:DNA-binding helix-hairpin-helix protein with protein kinase domain